MAKAAHDLGFEHVAIDYDEQTPIWWGYSSTWILLSENGEILKDPRILEAGRHIPLQVGLEAWTDDCASLFKILKQRIFGWAKSVRPC